MLWMDVLRVDTGRAQDDGGPYQEPRCLTHAQSPTIVIR